MQTREHSRTSRRRLLAVVALTLLGAVLAVVAALLVPRPYASTTEVIVGDRERAATYAILADGAPLARRVAAAADVSMTGAEVRSATSTTLVPGTLLIRVRATDSDPQVAQKLATTVVAQLEDLVADVDPTAGAAGSLAVATPANLPTSRIVPPYLRNLAVGAPAGLLLGLLVALLLPARRPSEAEPEVAAVSPAAEPIDRTVAEARAAQWEQTFPTPAPVVAAPADAQPEPEPEPEPEPQPEVVTPGLAALEEWTDATAPDPDPEPEPEPVAETAAAPAFVFPDPEPEPAQEEIAEEQYAAEDAPWVSPAVEPRVDTPEPSPVVADATWETPAAAEPEPDLVPEPVEVTEVADVSDPPPAHGGWQGSAPTAGDLEAADAELEPDPEPDLEPAPAPTARIADWQWSPDDGSDADPVAAAEAVAFSDSPPVSWAEVAAPVTETVPETVEEPDTADATATADVEVDAELPVTPTPWWPEVGSAEPEPEPELVPEAVAEPELPAAQDTDEDEDEDEDEIATEKTESLQIAEWRWTPDDDVATSAVVDAAPDDELDDETRIADWRWDPDQTPAEESPDPLTAPLDTLDADVAEPTPLEPPVPANRPPFGAGSALDAEADDSDTSAPIWAAADEEPDDQTGDSRPVRSRFSSIFGTRPTEATVPDEPTEAPTVDPLSDEYVVPEEDLRPAGPSYHDLDDTISSSVPLYVEPVPENSPENSPENPPPATDPATGTLLNDFLAEDDEAARTSDTPAADTHADEPDDAPEPDSTPSMWRPSRWIGS